MIKDKTNFSLFVMCLTVTLIIVFTSARLSAKTDSIEQCLSIQDNAKRLVCFDTFYIEKTSDDKEDAQQAEVLQSNKNTQSEMDEIDKRAQALMRKAKSTDDPFSANTPRISAKNNKQNEKPVDSFGAESMASSAPKEIQTSIVGLVEDARGYATMTLSNEQVWRQTETARFIIKNGDTVIIEKGSFQSYYLSKPDNNRRIRVKRIK